MSNNEKLNLPEGNFRAYIDSSFQKGCLDISHALIKGSSKKNYFLVLMYVTHQW